MEALGKFISFFNLPASYVAEHYASRCIVEYRTAHDELKIRDINLRSLSLDESVLDKMIDGTIDENFDKHDVELIEAYNDIEEFCGDKDWGYSYEAVRDLISSAKTMPTQDEFERTLRPRMRNQDAIETKLGMKYNPKLECINVCGCEKILVVNCVDLYNMYCQYCDSTRDRSGDGYDLMDQQRFNVILKECYKCGFLAERALFWNVLHLNRSIISYFNKAGTNNPAKVVRNIANINRSTDHDDQNHIQFKSDEYWSPNHELSCYIVRMRFNEESHQWEYVA